MSDELLTLQGHLLVAARTWSAGGPLDDDVPEIRARALRLCHARYLESVPLYRQLAEAEEIGPDASLDEIVQTLLFRDLFKSYDPNWLAAGDFSAMTGWLSEVSTLELEARGATSLAAWRRELTDQGCHVMFSTGTSGKMSFVPRDDATWKAWRSNSAVYARGDWATRLGTSGGFDLLVAGPKGGGLGILGAGVGLSRFATRAHFLQAGPLPDTAVQGAGEGAGAGLYAPATPDECDAAWHFAREAEESGRPLVVFGAPFQVRWLCESLAQAGRSVSAPEKSLLVTGGGWKSFGGIRLTREELLERVEAIFGIGPRAAVDTFGTTELNCVLASCPEGRYHVPPLLEPIVLDESLAGRPGIGGAGQLAFMDPFAGSYPGFVITGDVGLLLTGECECGLHGWHIEGEIGRAEGAEIKGCGGVLASAVV